jgi:uncharacterized protein YuzE
MKLRTTYSSDADTAYIEFGNPRPVSESVEAAPDLVIDLDDRGQIVGMELVTASRWLDRSALADAPADEFLGITELAEVLGKRKQNVAQHYTRLPDFPPPAAELASGRYWRRGDVEDWVQQREQERSSPPTGARRSLPWDEMTIAARTLERPKRQRSELRGAAQLSDAEAWRLVLENWLIETLEERGGSATLLDVSRDIWRRRGREIQKRGDVFLTWQYDLRWAAHRLRRRKVMKSAHDSPFGVWELARRSHTRPRR